MNIKWFSQVNNILFLYVLHQSKYCLNEQSFDKFNLEKTLEYQMIHYTTT